MNNRIACRHISHSVRGAFRIGVPFDRPVAKTLAASFLLASMVAFAKDIYSAMKTNLKLSACDTLYQNSVQITSSHIDTHTIQKDFCRALYIFTVI